MSLQICVLASGSSGNATVLWTEASAVLVDCGCSRRYIEEALASIGCAISLLKGIVITHGHGDHIGPATIALARKYAIPLYIHKTTFNEVRRKNGCETIGGLDGNLLVHHTRERFAIGEFTVDPFPTFHSGGTAGATFGFGISVSCGSRQWKVGYATDTGKVDQDMIAALHGSNVLVLEANHDPVLVEKSDRHPYNKRWVLSDYGHLNNAAAARTIVEVRKGSPAGLLTHVFLAHISQQHNTIEEALRQVGELLSTNDAGDIELLPTYHRRKSPVLKVA